MANSRNSTHLNKPRVRHAEQTFERALEAILARVVLSGDQGIAVARAVVALDLLRKYIGYSKSFRPALTQEALQRLNDFYLAMRSASEAEGSPDATGSRTDSTDAERRPLMFDECQDCDGFICPQCGGCDCPNCPCDCDEAYEREGGA